MVVDSRRSDLFRTMFNFEPVILRQSTSEIDISWKNVDNCDVYKIEHNTQGLEGKIVYWYFHDNEYCVRLQNSAY